MSGDSPTLPEAARALAAGTATSRALVEACLARIADPAGEGTRAFVAVDAEAARAAADYHDAMRARGRTASPFAGVPISVKDLFDVAGEVTRAGSVVLADAAPAERDAPVLARLRAAGFVLVGRTNMTEFAFSGIGMNPHYGTPRNPYDRARGRIPGGSSSGAAVSVTDGMALGAIGTDTGGSCRIPAALTGLVGFKPTAARVPLAGAVPLSPSLDSVGPLARSVACCAILDAVMAGEPIPDPAPDASLAPSVRGLRLGLPTTMVLDELEPAVAEACDRALVRLREAGAAIEEVAVPEFTEWAAFGPPSGLAAIEAFAWHSPLLARHAARYDRRVAARLELGRDATAATYIALLAERAALIARAEARTARFDALVLPTTPLVAPPIDTLDDADAFTATNRLLLRNPSVANGLDRCSISLPCAAPGDAPVGLMLIGPRGSDHRLLAIAAAIEAVLGGAA